MAALPLVDHWQKLEVAADRNRNLRGAGSQQKLVVAQLAGRNLDGLNPRGESETEWWVWLPRPNSNLRASPASWRRCSGPIDEASSGEIRLDDDVLGLNGSVV